MNSEELILHLRVGVGVSEMVVVPTRAGLSPKTSLGPPADNIPYAVWGFRRGRDETWSMRVETVLMAAIPSCLAQNLTTLLCGVKAVEETGRWQVYQNPRQLVSIIFASHVDRERVSDLIFLTYSALGPHRLPNCGLVDPASQCRGPRPNQCRFPTLLGGQTKRSQTVLRYF